MSEEPFDEEAYREKVNREVEEALAHLKGLDEAGRLCWMLGITREELDELGGI